MTKEERKTSYISDPNYAYLFEDEKEKVDPKIKEMYDNYPMQTYKPGDVVQAELVGQDDDHFLFNGNSKDYIRVNRNYSEFHFLEGKKVGDLVKMKITEHIDNGREFLIKGSIQSIHKSIAKQELKNLPEGESVNCYIKELTSAGYHVDIEFNEVKMKAFMPQTLAGINKLTDKDKKELVGKTLKCMIETYVVDKGTYIVSRRKYLNTLKPKALKELDYETVYTGNVTGTAPFGVFVEFNECLTGMIHRTNIHPEWQDRINEIKDGTEIDFYVKDIIKNKKKPEKSKIILTQIQEETIFDTIQPGDNLKCKIKFKNNSGYIVSLDENTSGMIHKSELEKLGNPQFKEDEIVNAKVLKIDYSIRKIFLTLNK